MFEFFMFLKQMVVQPFALLMAPFDAAEEGWEESRNRAMILGLPSVIVTVLAIIMLGFTQIGRKDRLESWYTGLLEKVQEDYKSQSAMLAAQESLAVTRESDGEVDPQAEIKRVKAEVQLLKEKEQIYLSKLMDLNPENPDYTFQLAMAYQNDDPEKQRALLSKLAPESEPVYFRAHEFMARSYYQQSRQAKSYGERKLLLELALTQVNHSLVQEANDPVAKSIKARILFDSEQYKEAAQLYSELFAIQPDYYDALRQVNEKLGNDNTVVLQTAIDKYEDMRKKNTKDDTKIWVKTWQNLVRCRAMLGDYENAINALQDEYQRQRSDAVRRKFLSDQISRVYTDWAAKEENVVTAGPEARKNSLERLRQAYKNNPNNPGTLKLLSWFVANDEILGPQAKEIYDPYLDPNPPADVLSELGSRSLKINDYNRAISLFKRARSIDSRNPIILNNLAYSHLVSQNSQKSATEALTLIEEGLRLLTTTRDPKKYASHLYHTRGTALMQLGRMEDAIASFENALRDRPNNLEIVAALIDCYEGRIDAQADMYRDYLETARANAEESLEPQVN